MFVQYGMTTQLVRVCGASPYAIIVPHRALLHQTCFIPEGQVHTSLWYALCMLSDACALHLTRLAYDQ